MSQSAIPEPHSEDRRTFVLCGLTAGLVMACGGGGGGAAATTPTPTPKGPLVTTDTKAALLATPDGTTRDYRNLGNFFLIKDATGIYAMTAICTHMGCTVGLPSGTHITCPCHGSQYDLGGANLVGPATAPLVHFAVSESTPGGALAVDVSQTVAASLRLA